MLAQRASRPLPGTACFARAISTATAQDAMRVRAASARLVKMIAEDAGLYAQDCFVYDSHKSGAPTVSHRSRSMRPT
jgi:hypothetical protein